MDPTIAWRKEPCRSEGSSFFPNRRQELAGYDHNIDKDNKPVRIYDNLFNKHFLFASNATL
jgi:hypothetical protein